jgi:thiol-disulfide isomerase/thioredoxin
MSAWVRGSSPGLAIGLALLVVLACAQPQPRRRGPAVRIAAGQSAPDEVGVTPAGDRVQMAQFKGKLVLLNFWATWCAPCRQELPRLEAFHRAYQDNGLEIVAVNYGETEQQVRAFLKANSQITLRVVLDPKAETGKRFGVNGLPTSVILDWNGVVRWARSGYDDAYQEQLLAQLNALVAELQQRSKGPETPPVTAPVPE